jgi:putative holliday junction resolvase
VTGGLRRLFRMRYVAIDLGDKRTGVAVGDDQTHLVSPLDVLEVEMRAAAGNALLEAIGRVVEAQLGPVPRAGPASAWVSPGEVVLGLPINMDGTEGPAARAARAFGARIQERTGRLVRFQDERLTSVDADWSMARSGMTRQQKKERRDALAAAAILRDFLAGLPPR